MAVCWIKEAELCLSTNYNKIFDKNKNFMSLNQNNRIVTGTKEKHIKNKMIDRKQYKQVHVALKK